MKKQGILALTFNAPSDYDLITERDRISLTGLSKLKPGELVDATIEHPDGKKEHIKLKHTMTEEQIGWYRAGSALNLIKQRRQN